MIDLFIIFLNKREMCYKKSALRFMSKCTFYVFLIYRITNLFVNEALSVITVI